jgi:hypothetical protein
VTRKGMVIAAGLLIASVATEAFAPDSGHAGGPWHDILGFDFFFGVIGCYGIVVVSKTIGKIWLQYPEPPDEGSGES